MMSHRIRPTVRAVLALVILLAAGASNRARAQGNEGTGTVRGRVTAAVSGRPIESAQVSILGTRRGTQTDDRGEFLLTGVPAGAQQLRVQRLGYTPFVRPLTVIAGQSATVDAALADAAAALDEVVVTGTAAQTRKKEIGNSMATIGAEQIANAPVVNTQDIIAARSPGVTVLANSGQPGAGGTIRLRGNNSVTQGNSPIVYVDGIRIYSESGPVGLVSRQGTLALNYIKADDIERVEIVKGAAATTLYGTEASGGVIQIFTKKGNGGAPQTTLELTGGANQLGDLGPKGDPTGLFLKQCRGPFVDSQGIAFQDVTCPASGSWGRSGGIRRLSSSIRGGTPALGYFVSANAGDEESPIPTGYSTDGGFRGNFSFMPTPTATFSVSTSYNKRVIRWVPDGNNANGLLLNVGRGIAGNFKGGTGECAAVDPSITCLTNAYILDQESFNRADHFVSGFTLNWNPVQPLSNRFSVGYDYNGNDNQTVFPFGFLNRQRGQILTQGWNHTKLSLDYAGSLTNTLGASQWASTLSLGGQLFEDREYYAGVTGTDFAGPGEPTLGSAARVAIDSVIRLRVVNAGFFVEEKLGWRDRVFLTAGLRVDGNSAFGKNFGLQRNPKVSASYVISEEDFWPKRWIETMKLRAAMGQSSKAPGAFDAVRTWRPIAGDNGTPAVTPAQRGNPNLGPERTREVEGGFDLTTLDGRVGVELSGFHTRTEGALIGVQYPASSGFVARQLENVGSIENRGLEVQLSLGLVRRPTFDWNTRVSVSSTKSNTIDVGGQEVFTGLKTYVKEGYPVPGYFGTKVTNPDAFENPVTARNVFIGGVYPTRIVSMGTTMVIAKRLTLDALGEFQGGAYLANWVGYQNALRSVWRPCYAVQQKLRLVAKDPTSRALDDVRAIDRARCAIDRRVQDPDFWIEKSDFFKLRSVSLSYEVPSRLVRFGQAATIKLAGRNLLRSTDYSGTDPEVQDARDAGGSLGRRDYYNLPPSRSFQASVRVTF
ncbi:MAG: SusC/RagA family TonB-linked outer membrane protein [Gemmatimonadaceae bacterium]